MCLYKTIPLRAISSTVGFGYKKFGYKKVSDIRKFLVQSHLYIKYKTIGYKKVSDIRTTLSEIVNFLISETYCSRSVINI